jgi:hypothetical protein
MTYTQSQHYSTGKTTTAWTDTTLGAAHFVTVIVEVLQFCLPVIIPPMFHIYVSSRAGITDPFEATVPKDSASLHSYRNFIMHCLLAVTHLMQTISVIIFTWYEMSHSSHLYFKNFDKVGIQLIVTYRMVIKLKYIWLNDRTRMLISLTEAQIQPHTVK